MQSVTLSSLANALNAARLAGADPVSAEDLRPLPPAGVAHDHVLIGDTGRIVRLPRLSQTGRSAADNLRYQTACFARAEPSGATPRLHGTLPPAPSLPMGALVIDAIAGRPVRLPDDLAAIARCLAAIHSLPVPDLTDPAAAGQLPVQPDPVASTLATIEDQAAWLDRAGLDPDSVAIIRSAIESVRKGGHWPSAQHACVLVVTDSHPGNYLIDRQGKAWFVDLEKAAYSQPAIDVAHATLPTSTGWDLRVTGTVGRDAVSAFESAYLAALPADVRAGVEPWLTPMRRLTWLRTVTWFVRWRARSGIEADPWNADDLPATLGAHLRSHVRDALSAENLANLWADFTGNG